MPFKFILRSTQNQKPMAIALALANVIAWSSFAHSAAPCSGVAQEPTEANKREYAELVAKSLNAKVMPSQVKIHNFMESGSWSAVSVSTPVSDDGVLFFQTVNGAKQFKDVWGGSADSSERPELIKWAKKLGAPDNLAQCFAHIVTE